MRSNYLDQFYSVDPDTGDYIIDISLNDYDDVFNSWDSSVYNIRDLDSSLKSFIQACSEDIDLRRKITLRFQLANEKKDPKVEKIIKQSMYNHFHYQLFMTKKRLRLKRKRAVFYVLASVTFTLASLYLHTLFESEVIYRIVLQGLTVGGWLFLWEAFSLLFLQSSEMRQKRREYRRLLQSPIQFRYQP